MWGRLSSLPSPQKGEGQESSGGRPALEPAPDCDPGAQVLRGWGSLEEAHTLPAPDSLAPVDYEPMGEIIRRQGHRDSITEEDLNSEARHAPGELGANNPSVVGFYLIHTAGMNFHHFSFYFDIVFSTHSVCLSTISGHSSPSRWIKRTALLCPICR